jgi:hypothetical protein
MTTPGELRQFAAVARRDVTDYRQWAHEETDPAKKRKYERWAEDREETADWYESVAARGEITVEYEILEPLMEAAE